MDIENGCNKYTWGSMSAVWDGYCMPMTPEDPETSEEPVECVDVPDVLDNGNPSGRTCENAWATVQQILSATECPADLALQCPQTCGTCPGADSSGVVTYSQITNDGVEVCMQFTFDTADCAML
eukprot:UN22506